MADIKSGKTQVKPEEQEQAPAEEVKEMSAWEKRLETLN